MSDSVTDRRCRRLLVVVIGSFCLLALFLALPQSVIGQEVDTSDASLPPVVRRVPISPLGDPFPYGSYNHEVVFDSTSNQVLIYETLLGERIGQPRVLTLEEYLAERDQEAERRMWEDRAAAYKFDTAAARNADIDRLSKIIGDVTNIEIPIPPKLGLPPVSISVNGSVNVSAGWQWDHNNVTSINSLGNTSSAPFFKQSIQVSLTGKIGDLAKISADFDNQRSFDFDNQMKISFGGGPGSEDNIIQSVELGNVVLQTPSTLIGGSTALFGAKAVFKFGPLLLTTIASQKRGERKTVTVSGGSVKTALAIKPFEYAQNHFWLDTAYRRFYDIYYANTPPSATPEMLPYNVTDIEVYEQVKDGALPAQFQAIAYADVPPLTGDTRYPATLREFPTSSASGSVQLGSFRRIEEGNGFSYDRQLGTVTIRSLQPDKLYAVAYRTSGGQTYGELSNTRNDSAKTVAVLKLIYISNMQPSFTTLWARQMKNIYQLQGVRNVDLQNSHIRITYGVPPDTSEVYKVDGSPRIVTALGVDRYNSSNEAKADGEFDIRSPYFFDPARGEIILPSTEPFRKGLRESPLLGANAERFVLDAIYDRTREDARRDTRVSQYTISGDIAGSGGGKISLGGFGLSPGSIKVIANGEQLRENLDYRVDPVFGEVTLISAKANNSTGNVVVEYEQNDFFTTAVKTLLGLRADYDLFTKRYIKSRVGMTVMRYSQSTQTQKVQIYSGDEPTSNLMIGFDATLDYKANWLTKLIDAIPLIDTKEQSTITLRGEVAWTIPNPNTKESLVASDLGKGAAYIDDFESGAKRQIQLSTSYTYWHPASPPIEESLGVNDSQRVAHKGRFYWYNRTPPNTETHEIWPNRDINQGGQKTSVLDIVYDPTKRGMYNWNFNYETGGAPPDSLWGGMMRSLSYYTTNLDEENIDYLEITMQVPEGLDPSTKLFIDLGQISEDVIPNRSLNTEDGITTTNPQPDDILNEGEDVGIDGMTDAQERQRFGVEDPDPSNDNYFFDAYGSDNPDDYKSVDGVEGNVGQERGPFPDTEDLNGNKGLDLDNTYFRYEVNLDRNPITNPQIVGGGDNPSGWRQYRIPIRTGFKAVGSPSFANIQFARLWIAGRQPMRIRVAEMNLVGSDWRNLNNPSDSARDPKLDISFVNLEDNSGPPDFYTIPPGVTRERDPGSDVQKNEQSLAIHVQDLLSGETRGAARIRPRPFDVFNYKQMKFFLHGGGDMDDQQTPGEPIKAIAFLRFGWDSLNYYEYRVPLLSGWNEYVINFPDLAAIKQLRGQLNADGVTRFPVPDQPTNEFGVRGTPSLTRIQFIAFGIENNAFPGALNTTMWVDELRAVGAEDAVDWAATVQAGAKLADFGSIDFNASRYNPNFHRLEERFGNRVETTTWAGNLLFQLEKFLPNDFKGSSIPLTYNHVERIEKPRYVAESDVEVEAATEQIKARPGIDPLVAAREADSLRSATETLVVQDGFAFRNFKIVVPGKYWAVTDVLNRLSFGYVYDQTRRRSPIVAQSLNWRWDFTGRYAVDIPAKYDIQPFKGIFADVPILNFWKDFKINFLPNSFAASTTLHRERTTEKLRAVPEPSPVIRSFNATRAAQFSWRMTEGGLLNVTTEYSLDTRSSLTHLETDVLGQQRKAGDIAGDLLFNNGQLFNFGLDNDLQQNITFNTRPRIPFIPDIDRYVTPSARYNVKYSWQDQLTQSLNRGSYTKSAQWTSTATTGLDIRLAAIGNVLFGDTPGRRNDTASEGALTSILRYLVKIPFLDFQTVRFNFTQTNTAKNPGVIGSGGITNLWGRSFLLRPESPEFGPGAAYQLGLISDPHGKLKFGLSSAFPFITTTTEGGLRAPNIYVQDNFTQKNTLTASTDRTLWPGATLQLNWSVDWGYNKNYSVTTDGNGLPTYSNTLITGNLTRTYMSLPNFLFFSFFNNDIEGVVAEYARRKGDVPTPVDPGPGATPAERALFDSATVNYNRKLTDVLSRTFEQQLEAFNWLPGEIGRFLPRVNYRFQWNGLEKLPFLDWAQSVSLRHEYKGTFTRNFRETDAGTVPETHTVSRGFSPLVQISVTGKPDVFKGTMTGSVSYNTTTDFALIAAARSEISKETKNELQLQFSYQKRGLSLPLFGLDLKNDVEFALTFSLSQNRRKRFNLTDFLPEGNNDGSTRINLRPSARYTISNAVQISAFVQYEATIPDTEGSREISRSTTKVGLDIRVGISGGR